jgi:hypothetical protein
VRACCRAWWRRRHKQLSSTQTDHEYLRFELPSGKMETVDL